MKTLTRDDIMGRDAYEQARPDLRRRIMLDKSRRRIHLGAHCTVHFESRDTMAYQIHEMLRVEGSWDRPGALEEELASYNALIPQAGELSATLMLEYETAEERAAALPNFVGLEKHLSLQIGDTAPARPTFDRAQTDERGVSSVQYLKWQLDAAQRERLKQDGIVVRLAIGHPFYTAQAILGEDARRAIMNDPD